MQAFLTLFYLLGLRKSFGVCAHDFEHLLEAIEGINVPCFLLRWFGSDAFPSCPRVQSAIVIHCVLFLENRIYVNTIIIFSCTSHVGEKKRPGVNHELLPKRARHLVPKRKNVQKEGDQSEALANSLF